MTSKHSPVADAVRDDLQELEASFKGVFAFFGGLYDQERGGFYRSIPDRDAPDLGPRLEATGSVLGFLERGGILARVPRSIRRDIAAYIQGLQDPLTGHFEDTEEAGMPPIKRRGRAVSVATPTLGLLGTKPLHMLPGDSAERSQTLDYLLDHDAFRRWTEDAKRVTSGSTGSVVQATAVFINALPEKQRRVALEWIFDWLASEQDPLTGTWWRRGHDCYRHLANTYKVGSYYDCFKRPIPNTDTIYQAMIACMRKQPATEAIDMANGLRLIRYVEPYLSIEIPDDVRVEMIRISASNARSFRTADGAYANLLHEEHGSVTACSMVLCALDNMHHMAGLPEDFPLSGADAFLERFLRQCRRP